MIIDDLRVFRATEGSTEQPPLVFGVENVLRITNKVGKRYRGVLEAAERFMVRGHEEEAEKSTQRHASVIGSIQGKA